MGCQIDESALPFLTGCPGPNEWIVVGNAVGGLDMNGGFTTGYGRRIWSQLVPCILSGLTFGYVQISVPSAQLSIGGTIIRVNQINVIQDSVVVVLDGSVLDRNDNTQVSYLISYDPTGFTITLNQGAQNLQTYVVTYAHA